ncbi:MAG TPA: type II secretion system F family protein [Gemmatimonadaceae bacterium]|nr:type II secretion system F family protein [Gemmatimonadaceae bacterium]
MMALVLAAVFLGTVLLIFAGYTLVNHRRLATEDALRERLLPGVMKTGAAPAILKEEQRASQLDVLNRLLADKTFTARVAEQLERAGSRSSVGEFVLLCAVIAGVGALIGMQLDVWAMPVFGLIGAACPWLYLKHKERVRLKAFDRQLPEAIDMLVNALKAGYSLQAAMKFIGDEMSQPLGPEFIRFYDEQRLGVDVRTALLDMQARTNLLDLKMFVTALLIQRETGGNLAEVMSNISTLMRERVVLRGQLDTLTAEPKLSAVVLALLPVLLFVVFSVLNPKYMQPLYDTTVGHVMLVYAVVSDIVGYLILRKIGDVDF